jgi:hypothetical protein
MTLSSTFGEPIVQQTVWDVVILYTQQGYRHILPLGLDHILFVAALFFSTARLKPLIWQVSAFTIAHTLTLALAVIGVITVPASIVEPVIALSIGYVAIENLLKPEPPQWRPLVVFGFGLFHGLGFAGVLGEYGLPLNALTPALLSFNLGVEAGQITVILALFVATFWLRQSEHYPSVTRIGSGLIAIIALWWTIERVVLAFGA